MLNAIDLECYRGDRLLFRNLNLTLKAGEILQVQGPNGSGKTSLLRILCGLTLPTAGEVHWRGENIHRNRERFLSRIVYVGHQNGIKLELSPLENLKIACSLTGQVKITPGNALLRFELHRFRDVPAYTLSAGQRRRVALARLLLGHPCCEHFDSERACQEHISCWILDEPFTALDRAGVMVMESVLEEHANSGGITILTTHQPLDINVDSIQKIELG